MEPGECMLGVLRFSEHNQDVKFAQQHSIAGKARRRDAKARRKMRDEAGAAQPSGYGAGVGFDDDDLVPGGAATGKNAAEGVDGEPAPKRATLCGLCHAPGHNARTCPKRLPAPAAPPADAAAPDADVPPANPRMRRLTVM